MRLALFRQLSPAAMIINKYLKLLCQNCKNTFIVAATMATIQTRTEALAEKYYCPFCGYCNKKTKLEYFIIGEWTDEEYEELSENQKLAYQKMKPKIFKILDKLKK